MIGPQTQKGRDFAANWRYPGFRRAFRMTTVEARACGKTPPPMPDWSPDEPRGSLRLRRGRRS